MLLHLDVLHAGKAVEYFEAATFTHATGRLFGDARKVILHKSKRARPMLLRAVGMTMVELALE